MTVENQTKKVSASTNGSATRFSFSPMVIFEASDLTVVLVEDSTGAETALSQGTGASNYSVNVSKYPGTGEIVYPADEVTPKASGFRLVMKRVLVLEQTVNLENQGGYFPDTQEKALDRATMVALQLQEELDRALKISVADNSGADFTVPTPNGGKALRWSDDGLSLVNSTDNFDSIVTDATTQADRAEAEADAAAASASAAATSETNAATSATNAATSAAEAEQYANSIGENDVVRFTADATLALSHNGNIVVVDASGGAVTITLPSIATVGEPYRVKVKKSDNSANNVTVAPSGTDTIDGAATDKTLNLEGSGATFSADLDTAPDDWATAAFGASSKLARRQYFFTLTGGQTEITGADDSGNTLAYSAVGLEVYRNGVRLAPADYTATDGSSVTLGSAATAGDEAHIISTGSFDVADTYDSATIDTKDAARVAKAGDTMTGALTLSADPTSDLHAATKQYVDAGLVAVGTYGTEEGTTSTTFQNSAYSFSATIPPSGKLLVSAEVSYRIARVGGGAGGVLAVYDAINDARLLDAFQEDNSSDRQRTRIALSAVLTGTPGATATVRLQYRASAGEIYIQSGGEQTVWTARAAA